MVMAILMWHLKIAVHLQDCTHINDEHIGTAQNLDITMPIYTLVEYSDNYSDA